MTQEELAQYVYQAQSGDRDSLEALTRNVRPVVQRQLKRYPLSDSDRDDALQNALLQVVRRLGSFRGDACFRTWLFRVTANEALMMMRSHRRHGLRTVTGLDLEELSSLGGEPLHQEPSDTQSTMLQSEREASIRDALQRLPAEYAEAVHAHYHEELGLQQIADRLHVTESTIRSRIHRARNQLRRMMPSTEHALASRAA